MNKEHKEYLLNSLEYALNDCKDESGNTERHFNTFANAIELVKNCSIPNVMQWVAVSEKLPELEGRYLCVRKHNTIVSVENFYPEHPENWLKFTGVTHWMPIVEPPCV